MAQRRLAMLRSKSGTEPPVIAFAARARRLYCGTARTLSAGGTRYVLFLASGGSASSGASSTLGPVACVTFFLKTDANVTSPSAFSAKLVTPLGVVTAYDRLKNAIRP